MEQAYFSSEVAKSLGVGASTLRKYALALEENGYIFSRGVHNSRVFYQKDISLMKRIIEVMDNQNLPVEAAIKLAIKYQEQEEYSAAIESTTITHDQPASPHTTELIEKIQRLEDNQEKLIAVNKELVKELANHQQWMKKKLEEQEVANRDRALLLGLEQRRIERTKPVYHIPSLFSFLWKRNKEAENM